MISGLRIKNFSILKDFSIGLQIEDLPTLVDQANEARREEVSALRKAKKPPELSNLLGLIGENASGKSTIFEALAYIRDIVCHNLSSASTFSNRGGYARLFSDYAVPGECMELSLLIKDGEQKYYNYLLCLSADKHQRPYIFKEELVAWDLADGVKISKVLEQREGNLTYLSKAGEEKSVELVDRRNTALALLSRLKEHEEIRRVYRRIKDIFVYRMSIKPSHKSREKGGHKHLKEQLNNLENVLQYREEKDPKAYFLWLDEILAKIPNVRMSRKNFRLEGLNSGELKLFEIFVLMDDDLSLICLDEPDLNLYYQLSDALLVEMRNYSLNNPQSQIFYTTHNYNMLQGLKPEELWILERNSEGASARAVSQNPVVQAMYEEGLDMGMLLYGGYLEESGYEG